MRPVACLFALTLAACATPAPSPEPAPQPAPPPPVAATSEPDYSAAVPIDEAYRAEFARCDRENIFRGRTMTGYGRCMTDPSRVERLAALDGIAIFTSKLGVDLDGSWWACNGDGPTDLCGTWLMLPGNKPVDSDEVPYIVIPIAKGGDLLNREFRNKTHVGKGDFGVAIYRGRVVPVIVADGGPFNKLGEGSMALHRAFNRELCAERNTAGQCIRPNGAANRSIESGVTTILFPGSARADLTTANVRAVTCAEGARLWRAFRHKVRAAHLDAFC